MAHEAEARQEHGAETARCRTAAALAYLSSGHLVLRLVHHVRAQPCQRRPNSRLRQASRTPVPPRHARSLFDEP